MNKAFDKILERLEKEKDIPHDDSVAEAISTRIWNKAIQRAKGIVQAEAEEFATDTNVGNNGWIPCSERLPKERDWYLAVFEEVDTGFIGIPYIADYLMGSHTKFTTEDGWIIRNCSDREDESAEYYKNLRCVAWQPLPQPYKESE